MGNIISVIGYALSQLARAFSLALLLAFLLEAVAALEIWFRKRQQSNTESSTQPNGPILSQQSKVILYINGEPFAVVPSSVVVSTSNETQPGNPSSSIGPLTLTFRLRPRRKRLPKTFSRYAARRAAPRLPAPWIPSARKRRKLRRKLTPQFL